MAIPTTSSDHNAILLVIREWEQRTRPPPMERGQLLELVGLCERVGAKASLVLVGQIRVAVAQTCTSVMEQWSAINDTGLTLAPPTRRRPPTRPLSQGFCIADLVGLVTFALAVGSFIRLCKVLGPSRSRGSRRIRQRQVFKARRYDSRLVAHISCRLRTEQSGGSGRRLENAAKMQILHNGGLWRPACHSHIYRI